MSGLALSDKAAVLSRLTKVLQRLADPVENERAAAVASFQSIVTTENIDLRDISLANGGVVGVDVEALVAVEVAKWRSAYRAAYPAEGKMRDEIDRLRDENKSLAAEVRFLSSKKVAREEERAAKAAQKNAAELNRLYDALEEAQEEVKTLRADNRKERTRLARLVSEEIETGFAFRLLRMAVDRAPKRKDQELPMDLGEMRFLLEEFDAKVHPDDAFVALGFEEPPDRAPPWLRLALRLATLR